MHYFIWMLVSALFFAAGEFFSKKFALAPSLNYVAVTLFMYGLGALAWLPALLQKNQLAITGTILTIMSASTTIFIGLVIFGETIKFVNALGLVFGFIAMVLLSL